ncbi:MAG: hypothetical protein R3178_06315 [Rhodothermales bacterium]|nr:hypothetical protein [Rhodothermales bacterium]
MIAYVFWHTPRSSVEGSDYEQGLEAFHSVLAGRPPGGYCSSLSLRVGRLPWMGDATSFEDWYLVDDFAALGELNDRAAADHHAATHDHVADYSDWGTGSIFALESGTAGLVPPIMYWLNRPEDMKTAAFLAEMRSWVEGEQAVLWRRQLSLGPSTEYCIHAPRKLALPFPALEVVPQSVIWPQ